VPALLSQNWSNGVLAKHKFWFSRATLLHPLTRMWQSNMVSHMKTTISIADDLLERAKTRASEEKKTLRAVVEEALRLRLAEGPRTRFACGDMHLRERGFSQALRRGTGSNCGISFIEPDRN
jgi:hypothetical protein